MHTARFRQMGECSNQRPLFPFQKSFLIFSIKNGAQGLPWGRGGWESACQCRGRGFEPWSGRIPHAAEQLGLCTTILSLGSRPYKPQLLGPVRLEPVLRSRRGHRSERPALQRGVTPARHNWRGSVRSNKDPMQPKIKKIINLLKKKNGAQKWPICQPLIGLLPG